MQLFDYELNIDYARSQAFFIFTPWKNIKMNDD